MRWRLSMGQMTTMRRVSMRYPKNLSIWVAMASHFNGLMHGGRLGSSWGQPKIV